MVDAIVIPGGGLTREGELPAWSRARFGRALEFWSGEFLIPLSAGTTHRPLALTATGRPIYEAHVGAEWLLARGVPEALILPETLSFDTIGNAFFARLLHTDPRGFRHLHVITSQFHLPRCEAIFDWVFSLSASDYALTYEGTADAGLTPEALTARLEKERASLSSIEQLRSRIRTLEDLHRWIYSEHDAYRASRPAWAEVPTAVWMDSY